MRLPDFHPSVGIDKFEVVYDLNPNRMTFEAIVEESHANILSIPIERRSIISHANFENSAG